MQKHKHLAEASGFRARLLEGEVNEPLRTMESWSQSPGRRRLCLSKHAFKFAQAAASVMSQGHACETFEDNLDSTKLMNAATSFGLTPRTRRPPSRPQRRATSVITWRIEMNVFAIPIIANDDSQRFRVVTYAQVENKFAT